MIGLLNDFYDDSYSDDPVYYEEHPFSDVSDEDWGLCGNCSNYLFCGRCALDKHEVDYDDPCTYNLKKEN